MDTPDTALTKSAETLALNSRLMEALGSDDAAITKSAELAATQYTRIQIREDSFAMKIQPPEKIGDSMLDRGIDERLQVICEIEPDSPGSKWVPFQQIPEGEYITSSRYIVPFARIVTPKFQKDLDELRTTRQDIRKILTDNSIKDGLAAFDSKWIETVYSIVFDCDADGRQNQTGKVQYLKISDTLNRASFAEAKKMLPRGNANGKFKARNYIALMNDVTAQDFLKLTRNEVGGDLAQDMFQNGLTTDKIEGVKLLFTIKSELVPENTVVFFAAPEFLGQSFYLTDWTMFLKKEAFMIEMFSYWLGGFAFGNIAAMAVAQFNVPAGGA